MKNSGNKPPISVPNKGKWMGKEMKTVKQFFGGECVFREMLLDASTD